VALFEEASRKRPAPAELAEASESSKRQRIDQASVAALTSEARPSTVAQLFTITSDPGAQNFNVQSIPYETVAKLIVPLLRTVDKARLDAAVNVSLSLLFSSPILCNMIEQACMY
jgi:symplekin